MIRVIKRYVADTAMIEDILHDGFFIIFKQIDRLHDYSHLETWMASIMKNLALKALADLSVEEALSGEDEEAEEESEEPMSIEELQTLISQLPEKYQNVFRLAVLEGLSHKEISQMLGITSSSSATQLSRAKGRLRQLFLQYQLGLGVAGLLFIAGGALYLTWRPHFQRSNVAGPIASLPIQNSLNALLQDTVNKPNIDLETSPSAPPQAAPTALGRQTGAPVAPAVVTRQAPALVALAIPDRQLGWSVVVIPAKLSLWDLPPHATTQTSPAEIDPLLDPVAEYEALKKDTPSSPDSITPKPRYDEEPLVAHWGEPLYRLPSARSASKWAMTLSTNLSAVAGADKDLDLRDDINASLPPDRPSDGPSNPSDPTNPSNPSDLSDPSQAVRSSQSMPMAGEPMAVYDTEQKEPIVVSVRFAHEIAPKISLEVGVQYTLLRSTQWWQADKRYGKTDLDVSYLGVTVAGRYDWFTAPHWRLSTPIGTSIDFPIATSMKGDHPEKSYHAPVQVGFFGGVSLEYRFNSNVGLFIEPQVNYHLDRHSTFKLLWQDKSTSFTLPIGIRFSW